MDTLVEVHDEPELERALRLDASLLGINNRNLKTLDDDLAATERLAPLAAGGPPIVCESGLHGPEGHRPHVGCSACTRFLVGESLMRQPDVARWRRLHCSRPVPAARAAEG